MKPIDILHVGPQKTATTWVYRCLKEHPEIACPPSDATHFFSMYYHRGRDWYSGLFEGPLDGKKILDPTPNYFRSPVAAKRIYEENPHARLIVCLRHPIERAFSHYWHEKKKKRFDFTFEEVLENFDLYTNWLEPGMYSMHLKRFLEYFPREQILCQVFDDLELDPEGFLRQILEFIEVNEDFRPSVLHKRINVARPAESRTTTKLKSSIARFLRTTNTFSAVAGIKGRLKRRSTSGAPNMERLSDLPQALLDELSEIFEPEYDALEKLVGVKLDAWRNRYLAGRNE